MLSGEITKATIKTIEQANKALRFAKSNGDCGLVFQHVADRDQVSFVAYSDASFATRKDLSSQGGYLVLMTSRGVAQDGAEGNYVVLDWRSWKLARVARSTLSAESQAASEAADSLLYVSTFWNLIWAPWKKLEAVETAKAQNESKLVIDAKALFDMLIKEDNNRDRLRSHVTRLKTDESFQASKKKDAATRKRNTEMYAIKKPKRALQAMFTALTGAYAQNIDFNPDECKMQDKSYFDFAEFLTILLVLLATILVIFLSYLWWRWNSPMAHPEPEREPDETAAQRLRDEVEGLRREIDMHHRDKVRLRAALEDRIADYQRLLKTYKDYQADYGPHTAANAVHRAAQSFIYMDDGSRFWHSSYYCAKDRTDREILKINWCRRCSQALGASDNGPRHPDCALSGALDAAPLLRETLEELAERHQKTLGQVLLRWGHQTSRVLVTTTSNPQRSLGSSDSMEEYLDMFSFELTEQEVQMISSAGFRSTQKRFTWPKCVGVGKFWSDDPMTEIESQEWGAFSFQFLPLNGNGMQWAILAANKNLTPKLLKLDILRSPKGFPELDFDTSLDPARFGQSMVKEPS
eukprot:s2023_g8.t1